MRKHLLSLLILVLAGCASVPETTSQTPTALDADADVSFIITNTPAVLPQTNTPQPPLKAHEWTPSLILARLDFTHENKDESFNPSAPPRFVLYGDGKLFLTRPLTMAYPYSDQQLLFKQLERGEMCRILNTLDQKGFLDYDPEDYQFIGGEPNMADSAGAFIQVNAWKSHEGHYYGLPLYILEELTGVIAFNISKAGGNIGSREGFPVISPALRDAYYLFAEYPVEDFEIYQPSQLAVWVLPLDPAQFTEVQWLEWRLSSISLASLTERSIKNNASLTLRGGEALAVYKYLQQSFSTQYYYEVNKKGEKSYYVFHARPLLPNEQVQAGELILNPLDIPFEKLTCLPSDGEIAIPEPALIFTLPTP